MTGWRRFLAYCAVGAGVGFSVGSIGAHIVMQFPLRKRFG